MFTSLLAYISWLMTLLVLDGVMIYFVILPTFRKYIPTYLNTEMNYIAAIAFYLLYILILLLLVVIPWFEWKWTLLQVVEKSALFGFGAYMTYELTSMSVMNGWSWHMVAVDTLWGTVLTMAIGAVMFSVYKYFV